MYATSGYRQVLGSVWSHIGRTWHLLWLVLMVVPVCSLDRLNTPWLLPVAWGEASPHTASAIASPAVQAGLDAFQRGDFAEAVQHWRQAVQHGAQTQPAPVRSQLLTYLARAYEALGHYDQAEETLRAALALLEHTSERRQQASILGNLGQLALARGEVAAADQLVSRALHDAHDLDDADLAATLWYIRGNLLMAQHRPHEALAVYRDSAAAARQAQQNGATTRALVHAALAAQHDGQDAVALTLLAETHATLQNTEPTHDTVYDYLLVGRLYDRLVALDPFLVLRAEAAFRSAATMAQDLGDQRALSYAWGYLGHLYEDAKRDEEALQLTRRAVLAAQHVHMPEGLYLWQWQTARLLRALDRIPAALAAYRRAIDTVQTLRTSRLQGYGSPFTSFRTDIGPLFFEMADLLLRRAEALEAPGQETTDPQGAVYLDQARETVERFKTIELRDYFGDACVAALTPRTTALEQVAPETAIVYPILLPDRTEILLSVAGKLHRIPLAVPGPQLAQRVHIFRNALEDRDPLRYLQHAQQLYTWLISPLEAILASEPIQTLVFVPDGALRALPLAALHDGQRFLIEKYGLAITPSLTLSDPRPLPRDRVEVLAAGLADAVDGFSPLPRVPDELHTIQQLYGGSVLLDQAFNPERLQRLVQQRDFSIMHIASHGYFAPDADNSFLLTAEGKLTFTQFAQIVGRLRFRKQPLELLTLSACETARGDDRAALGLAGVAIQAGARSAIATLWLVEDNAAALVMKEFYRRLQAPAVSRSQALQEAQLTLLAHPQYHEPFFWAPFLLINNWL